MCSGLSEEVILTSRPSDWSALLQGPFASNDSRYYRQAAVQSIGAACRWGPRCVGLRWQPVWGRIHSRESAPKRRQLPRAKAYGLWRRCGTIERGWGKIPNVRRNWRISISRG